jgi:riboflavin kinase/FMN adenylyltransferase
VRVIRGLKQIEPALSKSVMSVGNFDGVHRGHQRIIAVGHDHARQLDAPMIVLTFEPHPLEIVRPEAAPKRLTTASQKLEYLRQAGADVVVVAESTHELLGESPEAFIADVVRRFRPAVFVEGLNFGFGKGRRGNVDTLREHGRQYGYEVHVVEPVVQDTGNDSVRVSSSMIRAALDRGNVELAARALGRAYALAGEVVSGANRGKALGFPTANLAVEDQLVPADGVYAGVGAIGDRTWRAAISIGTNPTFDGHERQVEAHLLDCHDELYGARLTLHLHAYLRPQRRFASRQGLIAQITEDVGKVREMET